MQRAPRVWQGSVETAKGWRMYNINSKLSGAVGGGRTAVCSTEGQLFTFGVGSYGQLGHGGQQHELVPMLIEAVGEDGGWCCSRWFLHTVWTEVGDSHRWEGNLGHGGHEDELVPRLVEALVGKKVIGAAAGEEHTAVWTEAGELFTFGNGYYGRLGHGGTQDELVPRLVEALVGKMVIGAAAGNTHTVARTDEGELFTFGHGHDGKLGHGGTQNELVPRLVEAQLLALQRRCWAP